MVLLGALGLAFVLRDMPLLGWDWFHTIREGGDITYWYPGWTQLLTRPLAVQPWRWGLALSNGLTLAAVAIATYQQRRDRWGTLGAVLAVLTPHVFVLLWAGQVDGWALLGYLIMPWGVPLLLIKPTIGAFALLTRRSWFLAGVIFALLTLVVWGWWPAETLRLHVTEHVYTASTMGWYILGWPVAVLALGLLLFTNRKDPFHMMAAGAFAMPYAFPYHFVLLLPLFGRWAGLRQLLLWLAAWVAGVSFAMEAAWAWTGYLFPMVAWVLMFTETKPADTWLAELQRIWGHALPKKEA
ncbi:MAG: hypothetical protein KIS88_05505 [Anaerolineales bacterium]|nr:hypothetical protein [Anaerolineales bacterium]